MHVSLWLGCLIKLVVKMISDASHDNTSWRQTDRGQRASSFTSLVIFSVGGWSGYTRDSLLS